MTEQEMKNEIDRAASGLAALKVFRFWPCQFSQKPYDSPQIHGNECLLVDGIKLYHFETEFELRDVALRKMCSHALMSLANALVGHVADVEKPQVLVSGLCHHSGTPSHVITPYGLPIGCYITRYKNEPDFLATYKGSHQHCAGTAHVSFQLMFGAG